MNDFDDITYLRRYKLRGYGRALVYKLDFEIFGTSESRGLLRNKWEYLLTKVPNSLFSPIKISYFEHLIPLELEPLKINKTIGLKTYERFDEERFKSLSVNDFCIRDDQKEVMQQAREESKNEINLMRKNFAQVRKNLDIVANSLYRYQNIAWCELNFVPAIYDEPIFLGRHIRGFVKPPKNPLAKNYKKIGRENYERIIRFLHFNLKKKFKTLHINIKIFRRTLTKTFKLIFRAYSIFRSRYYGVLFLLKKMKKYSMLHLDLEDHRFICIEVRKLKYMFIKTRNIIKINRASHKFAIKNFKVDLNKFKSHMESLRRKTKFNLRYKRFFDLLNVYHAGYQYFYKKLKEFFFDFHANFKIYIREFDGLFKLLKYGFKYFKRVFNLFLNIILYDIHDFSYPREERPFLKEQSLFEFDLFFFNVYCYDVCRKMMRIKRIIKNEFKK